MLPRDEVVEIKYFTALVDKRPDNPDGCERQATYLRALKTIPNLSVYLGRFLTTEIYARRVYPAKVGANRKNVKVYKTEEKGSDVNLACELLIDGFKGNYELAVVVSNDGDLKHPVHHVRHELGLPVGVLNPRQYRSRALSPNPLPKGSFLQADPPRSAGIKPVPGADAGRAGNLRAAGKLGLERARAARRRPRIPAFTGGITQG